MLYNTLAYYAMALLNIVIEYSCAIIYSDIFDRLQAFLVPYIFLPSRDLVVSMDIVSELVKGIKKTFDCKSVSWYK